MDQFSLIRELGQVGAATAGDIFREYLRGTARAMLLDVMAEEVTELCGRKHQPSDGNPHHRAGSAEGTVVLEGRSEKVRRPRVRKTTVDGATEEVRLQTYESAQQRDELHEMMLRALTAGVSGREMADVHPKSPGVSKSSVSRLWKEAGTRQVEELRSKDIASQDWLVMMLDGIVLSKELTAIVAIGVAADGMKHVLDFALGSTENQEVCGDLLSRIVARGFTPRRRLLVVLDGSKALAKAVRKFFPDAVFQRCLVHKERNLRGYLSKREWGELTRLFKRLREVQGAQAAREVYAEIEAFLKPKNSQALESFYEAGEELIALHSLGVPSTLHKSLLSTNLIENSFRNTRRKLGHVTRFRAETDQASRWLAFALLEVEKGFRRIAGWRDLPSLAAALESPTADSPPFGAASPLRPTACAPSPHQTASN